MALVLTAVDSSKTVLAAARKVPQTSSCSQSLVSLEHGFVTTIPFWLLSINLAFSKQEALKARSLFQPDDLE